jgi:signal transduction histidine kinase
MNLSAIWRAPARFLDSMAGRIFLFLTLGTCAAAILSLLAAEQMRSRDNQLYRRERVVESAVDIADGLRRTPQLTQSLLSTGRVYGVHLATKSGEPVTPDAQMMEILKRQLTHARGIEAGQTPYIACKRLYNSQFDKKAAGAIYIKPDCWVIGYVDDQNTQRSLIIDVPNLKEPASSTLNPIYLCTVILASALLSAVIARWASAPIRRLEASASAFSLTLDAEPLPERGPSEVRTAIATFNLMQQRVRTSLSERIHLLAAISHDLQTPLTRLRLRLEQVQDPDLRERLIADLTATQTLVREGLELARSSESSENWAWVDLDSLLASLAEDASEFGSQVTFTQGCKATVRVKPNALIRCLSNLIDNAVKYAGSAELGCHLQAQHIVITVRDHGPGIPDALLEMVFDPFVRGDDSRSRETGGTGIGLTIARAQAKTFDADITLANHPGGGLIGQVQVRLVRQTG